MFGLVKSAKLFSKVKPLKISVLTATPTIKVKSETTKDEWEVKNPLESLLASLIGCEVNTLKDYSRR